MYEGVLITTDAKILAKPRPNWLCINSALEKDQLTWELPNLSIQIERSPWFLDHVGSFKTLAGSHSQITSNGAAHPRLVVPVTKWIDDRWYDGDLLLYHAHGCSKVASRGQRISYALPMKALAGFQDRVSYGGFEDGDKRHADYVASLVLAIKDRSEDLLGTQWELLGTEQQHDTDGVLAQAALRLLRRAYPWHEFYLYGEISPVQRRLCKDLGIRYGKAKAGFHATDFVELKTLVPEIPTKVLKTLF